MGRRTIPKEDIFPVDRKAYRKMLAMLKEADGKNDAEKEMNAEFMAECRYFELLGRGYAYDPGFFANAEDMKAVLDALKARRHGFCVSPTKNPAQKESPPFTNVVNSGLH